MDNISQISVEDLLSQFSSTTEAPVQTTPTVIEPTPGVNPLDITYKPVTSEKTVEELLAEANPESTEEETKEEVEKPVESTPTKGRPKDKLDAADLNSIQLLINSGKLQPWVNEKNEVILPTTQQELLELMDENLETINQNSYQEVEQNFYQTKSPVWQQLLKYSETARSLDEVVPLFAAMQDMETIQTLDTNNEAHQEHIIRQYGLINGLDAETIDADIEDYKERGKLQERAEKLKPGLDRYNEQRVQQELVKKQQEDQQKQYLLQTHYNNVVENVMNKKEIGGIKLKNEHRQYVASTLVPDDNIGGLPIYTLVDNLLQKGDFDTLARIALLATNPQVHDSYYSAKAANETAAGLQRTLRTANAQQTGSIVNTEYEEQAKRQVNWIDKSKKWL